MSWNRLDQDWLAGRASLGAAGGWNAEEMRLVADVGYALAEQGRYEEAVTLFEGLAALGALWLRKGEPRRALPHLSAALAADPRDTVTLVNRGEAHLQLGDAGAAREDLRAVADADPPPPDTVAAACVTRAKALLYSLDSVAAPPV